MHIFGDSPNEQNLKVQQWGNKKILKPKCQIQIDKCKKKKNKKKQAKKNRYQHRVIEGQIGCSQLNEGMRIED